jgi:hypothetical protein
MINNESKVKKVFEKCCGISSHFSVCKKYRTLLKGMNQEELYQIHENIFKTRQVFQEQR